MKITNVHMNSPIQVRYTIEYKGHERVRFFGIFPNDTPDQIAQAMADNITLFTNLVDTDSLRPYNSEEHIAGILRDARRYGTD